MKTYIYIMLNLFILTSPMLIIMLIFDMQFTHSLNPIKQLISLMLFIVTMSIYTYLVTSLTLYPMMVLLAFMTGIIVLFSYFLCLLNTFMIPNKNMIIMIFIMMILLIFMFLWEKYMNIYMNIQFLMNTFYYKTNKIFIIYMFPKSLILIIFSLILILYLSFLICYSPKNTYEDLIKWKNLSIL